MTPPVKRVLLGAAVAAAFALGLVFAVERWPGAGEPAQSTPAPDRIVSLTPAITETLFAIGAGEQVRGVSDYCEFPPAVRRLPRVGTGLFPDYEAIAELDPTLIVSERSANAPERSLRTLAPVRFLPWLELEQITGSIRELGRLSGRGRAAERLASRLHRRLSADPPSGAPEVLLVLGHDPGRLGKLWFIRRNSLHGAALRAAGARNAVQRDVTGVPELSPRQLLELDPGAIIVLVEQREHTRPILRDYRQLEPLSAVRADRVAVVHAPEGFAHGPRVLKLVDRLAATVSGLQDEP